GLPASLVPRGGNARPDAAVTAQRRLLPRPDGAGARGGRAGPVRGVPGRTGGGGGGAVEDALRGVSEGGGCRRGAYYRKCAALRNATEGVPYGPASPGCLAPRGERA